MAGSPRSLVCGRCGSWWPFPRATASAAARTTPRRSSRSWSRTALGPDRHLRHLPATSRPSTSASGRSRRHPPGRRRRHPHPRHLGARSRIRSRIPVACGCVKRRRGQTAADHRSTRRRRGAGGVRGGAPRSDGGRPVAGCIWRATARRRSCRAGAAGRARRRTRRARRRRRRRPTASPAPSSWRRGTASSRRSSASTNSTLARRRLTASRALTGVARTPGWRRAVSARWRPPWLRPAAWRRRGGRSGRVLRCAGGGRLRLVRRGCGTPERSAGGRRRPGG